MFKNIKKQPCTIRAPTGRAAESGEGGRGRTGQEGPGRRHREDHTPFTNKIAYMYICILMLETRLLHFPVVYRSHTAPQPHRNQISSSVAISAQELRASRSLARAPSLTLPGSSSAARLMESINFTAERSCQSVLRPGGCFGGFRIWSPRSPSRILSLTHLKRCLGSSAANNVIWYNRFSETP